MEFLKAHQDLLNTTWWMCRQHVLTLEAMVVSHFGKLLSSCSLSEAYHQHRVLGTIHNPLLQKSTSTPTQDISLILIPLWVKMHLASFTTYIHESLSFSTVHQLILNRFLSSIMDIFCLTVPEINILLAEEPSLTERWFIKVIFSHN